MTLIPFDDRDGQIWFDGVMTPWRDAKLHVLSHGLHYGSGVFEGERAYAGNIFQLRTHTERFFNSARILGFDIPYTVDEIEAACMQVVAANGLADAYIRPIAWRGSEQLAVSAQMTKIHVAIATWAWPSMYGADRMKGVRLDMATWKRPHPETAPTASKATGMYMIGTLSKHAAEAKGFNDALMLDWRGHVAEATGANVFFVFDGELHTPTPDCFLDGITRRAVMRLAARNQIKVVERTVMPEELARANEVFLVGTAAEVSPVREIAGQTYTPGAITETLLNDFEKLVRMAPEEVQKQLAA
jgi:branched-chain amino acid aminotransferase